MRKWLLTCFSLITLFQGAQGFSLPVAVVEVSLESMQAAHLPGGDLDLNDLPQQLSNACCKSFDDSLATFGGAVSGIRRPSYKSASGIPGAGQAKNHLSFIFPFHYFW